MKSCDLIYIDLSLIVACVSVDSCSNWDRRKNCLWPVTYNWCTLGACTANRQVRSVGIHWGPGTVTLHLYSPVRYLVKLSWTVNPCVGIRENRDSQAEYCSVTQIKYMYFNIRTIQCYVDVRNMCKNKNKNLSLPRVHAMSGKSKYIISAMSSPRSIKIIEIMLSKYELHSHNNL